MNETSSSGAAVGVAVGPGRLRLIDAVRASCRAQSHRLIGRLAQIPPSIRLGSLATGYALVAAFVAYEAATNPHAAPANVAALVRVLIIGILIAGGIYAQTSHLHMRMGALLVAAGVFSSIWLLNGSGVPGLFSIGALCAGVAPTAFSLLMLAHPSGRIGNESQRRFLLITGGLLLLLWFILLASSAQPPIRTALLQCSPHCPDDVFTAGSLSGTARSALEISLWITWALLTIGTAVMVQRRAMAATGPVRHSIVPVSLAAWASALAWIAYGAAAAAGASIASALAAAYLEMAIVIPLAIVIGLIVERLFMGQALADFVTGLARAPNADPEPLMAAALRDPSLQIGYRRLSRERYVDVNGDPVLTTDLSPTRAATLVRRGYSQVAVAAVIYDAEISDQDRFVRAAGAAAMMRLERAQLEADLRASAADLAASRSRLIETADAERQRIERDLHDSIQQDLVALRMRLDMVAEAVSEDPPAAEMILSSLGRQMDDVLEALRSVARGVYPSLLRERGLGAALRSVARRAPLPVSVDARGVGRYSQDLEIAVYFCCLEALQNAIKYAGREATVEIRVRHDAATLEFQVADSGVGFDFNQIADRHGLLNMRDRIDAVGGAVVVSSHRGRGTLVRGRVPLP